MNQQQGFPGFSEEKVRSTPIPNPFFSDLLPAIDHLGEMKVTLYAFWALAQKEGRFRYLRKTEMAADQLLLEGLASPDFTPPAALDDALERAVSRGTLLSVSLEYEDQIEILYFLNTPKGRAAVSAIEDGEWLPSDFPDAPIELRLHRPNIFNLYEQNIGPLTPMMADQLRAAEQDFPAEWIEEAIRIAVENNVRKWRYVEAILKDWRTVGKDERKDIRDTEKARRSYLEGELGD
jgi:DnaD/phage-associated family protein